MKNTIIGTVFAILFSVFGIQKVQSQYRQYKPLRHHRYQKESIHLYRYSPIIRSGYTRCCTEVAPFNYTITYNNMAGLLAMQNAINRAERAKVERWLREQENNFKDEINQQLFTHHTTFKDAQKAFFKSYEENLLRLNNSIDYVAGSHSKKSVALDKEQEKYTNELILSNNWRNTQSNAYKIFSRTEHESALHKSWAQGVYRINENNVLTTEMVNKHISHYNSRGLQDKVFLMTAYLTQYKNRFKSQGPLAVPLDQYKIPPFWSNKTLLERGKKKATPVSLDARIFAPDFDSDCQRGRPRHPRGGYLGADYCGKYKQRREQIIQEHMDDILYKVDDSKLTGKAKCVYEKLQKTNITSLGIIQQTYISFNDEFNFKNYNLSYELGSLGRTKYGKTTKLTNRSYKITINEDYIESRSTIEIARTILHESIHALLLKEAFGDGKESFIDLFKNYIEKSKDEDGNISNNILQHSIMRDKYVIPIAKGLQMFDGYSEDFSYYLDIAWIGLSNETDRNQRTNSDKAIKKARAKGLDCK
ncbi:SprT-like domain-containing protein [uncultured Maribacter sp.]|uniref:SprT-like domain-containing protein n=1 Tax=uncultured Maribacter sp. TaxID=431308 RepID=UPI0026356775|nr:SprT-like domain-containing protein [uncultured Maribacter sp.]